MPSPRPNPIRVQSGRRRRRWPVLLAGAVALTLALLGCQELDQRQRHWIFQAATSAADGADEGAQLDGIADVWIPLPTATGAPTPRLHGLWLDGPSKRSPVLLYLHGARRNVESSEWRIRRMRGLGFAVLAIDYRGFGRSSDALPSEASVDADARAAWAWIAARHPRRDRYLFGHSLGGAIAIRLATEVDDVRGLIVEGTFTSIAAVFQTFRWGWLPITSLITQRFDSVRRIERVTVPLLVVHGTDDSMIPSALGRELYEHATTPRKRFVLVEGGTHYSTNDLGEAQYRQALRELFGLGA